MKRWPQNLGAKVCLDINFGDSKVKRRIFLNYFE
jgi:hypothetical protein